MDRHQGRVAMLSVSLVVAAGACAASDEAGPPRRQTPSTAVPPGPTPTPGASAGSGGGQFGNPDGTLPEDHGAGRPIGEAPGPCVNLQCQQMDCFDQPETSISGTVYDPAGNNPLYNVAVYVPNEPLAALPTGATCDECDSLYTGNPIAATLTDSAGRFVLPNAPVGANIPLVVQIGKWRRQFTVANVAACADNAQPDGMLRLPRNSMEGDLPKIAIATGGADTLECLLRRIGVDATEYVPGPDGAGRVHIFAGSGRGGGTTGGGLFGGGGGGDEDVVPNTSPPAPLANAALWSSAQAMMGYDIVLLSCEGAETAGMNQQALYEYANAGGRVFASHFHYSWFNTGPFGTENLAGWLPGSNDLGDIAGEIITMLPDGQPFPKGQALFEWLGHVGALQGTTLPIREARHNADVLPDHRASQPWIKSGAGSQAPGATQYFSFNTPVSAALSPDSMYCGRVVYSDLHVGAAAGDDSTQPVPTSCAASALTPQEAALEFMLFDLSSCLTPDDRPPQPPTVL
jgi:hypothetical protein